MNYIPPGTKVVIDTGSPGDDVHGVIQRVFLGAGSVEYECVWWDGATRYCELLQPREVREEERD